MGGVHPTRKSRERTAPPPDRFLRFQSPQPIIQRNAARELVPKGRRRSFKKPAGRQSGWADGSHRFAQRLLRMAQCCRRKVRVSGSSLNRAAAREILLRPSFFYQLSRGEPGRPAFRLSGAAILKDAYKSRFLADLYLGDNPAFFLEYYHPFDGSAYFMAPGLSVERTHYSIYDGKERSDQTRDRFCRFVLFWNGHLAAPSTPSRYCGPDSTATAVL